MLRSLWLGTSKVVFMADKEEAATHHDNAFSAAIDIFRRFPILYYRRVRVGCDTILVDREPSEIEFMANEMTDIIRRHYDPKLMAKHQEEQQEMLRLLQEIKDKFYKVK